MTARFVYWWPGMGDNGEPAAFYRDEAGSDVTGATLLEAGQPIPLTPTFSTWQKMVAQKLRCPKCWAENNGEYDFEKHNRLYHLIDRIGATMGRDANA